MKSLILLFISFSLVGCSVPHEGDYLGGPDRCAVGSAYGCHLYVVNGHAVNGVGVNVRMVDGQLGGGKPPSVINDM